MGRRSWNLPWPPYSPDLTSCDFFLWGYIKSIVYRTQPQNLDELQARIQDAFDNLLQEMIDRAIECYERRLQRCIDVDGRNVEQNYADEGNFLP
uniref:Transposase n=1 Tax=Acrobeloides nanus TaxID=290746 RepID=A0A914C8R5_9BILA